MSIAKKLKGTLLYRAFVDLLYFLIINPINKRRLRSKKNIVSKHAGTKEVFEVIYKNNLWDSNESNSGTGSTLSNTTHLRERLSILFKTRKIKSILDLPCGDFNWMKFINLSDIQYIGGDIVSEVINQNKIHETNSVKFMTLDLIQDKLPKTELILVRDCFVHLSISEIQKAIDNIKESGICYLLTTTFTEHDQNADIKTGLWRPLNLQQGPFNFPQPLELIEDFGSGNFKDKNLGLWKISDLP